MATATVSRRFIDGGLHEAGEKIEVSETRLAELIRMGLVVDPTQPVDAETDPATDAAKKGKK